MTPEAFEALYPAVAAWIQRTLEEHAEKGKTVASRGFPRLPSYFTDETLACANVL